MDRKRFISAASTVLFFTATVFVAILSASDAGAYPFFSRKVGRDCTFCHTAFPMLNETGRIYRSNGFRFAADEWKEVRDWQSVPFSAEAEVEGAYNRVKSGGVATESSDLKIEEAEMIAGGAFGKTGKVTALVSLLTEQTDTGYDTSLHKAFVQVNDLIGAAGEGALNLKAGQFDIGLPFLNTMGTPVSNRYLAGVVRENVYDDNKLRGYYAWYSATFKERYNIGGIYRGGHEKSGSTDASFDKWGLAASAEAGPFILTAGYFRADRSGSPAKSDYVAELLYQPVSRVSLAARYDYLKEKGAQGVKSQTFMARYGILSNVYAQIEYRGLKDTGHVAGTNEDEDKVRVFLTAIF